MKRGLIFLILLVTLFGLINISALGVSPAKITLNYEPNAQYEFNYQVSEISENQEVFVSVEGDLNESVSIDKDSLIGPGNFGVKLNLPSEIETPGKHRILIVVREKIDEEISTISTAVKIRVAIDIYVPYPGKYLEMEFSGRDANIGEDVEFSMNLISRGDQNLSANPKIEIYSEDELIETLTLKERFFTPGQELELKKTLSTLDYNPGIYKALALVDYDSDVAEKSIEFRLGTLIISILDYTKEFLVGKEIQVFEIGIESGWNNEIDGAYADVVILKGSEEIIEFKTSSASLKPWENKTIKGIFDSSEISPGDYRANITVNYFGRDTGESVNKVVNIKFVEESNLAIILIIVGVVLIILILLVIIFFKKKLNKK